MLKVSYPPQSSGHVQHHPLRGVVGHISLAKVSRDNTLGLTWHIYFPTCLPLYGLTGLSLAELRNIKERARNNTMELSGSGATAFCLAVGIMVFTGYYLTSVVRKPRIICKPKSFISKLIKHSCPFVHELYWPTFWCFGGRAQTVIASLLKSHPSVDYSREFIHMPDGGVVALDWANAASIPTSHFTVLILPGLTGTSDHNYIRHFVLHIIQELDCSVAVLNNRGLGGLPLKTLRVCCAADTGDLEYVIFHIKKRKPNFPLMVIGISLGGIILTNLLCKMGQQEKVNDNGAVFGAAVISAPWDLFKTSESLEQPVNHLLFNRHLTKLLRNVLKQQIARNMSKLEFGNTFDLKCAFESHTVRELDDRIIAPLSGYKDGNDYYTAATLHIKPLEKINVPLLFLNAADDPFAPEESIPFTVLHNCPNVAMVLTKHGGHVGFTEGLFPRGSGYMERVVIQYLQALCGKSASKICH